MKSKSQGELLAVFDVDLVAYLIYSGVPISRVSDEFGRVAFHFPANDVATRQAELAAGKARTDPIRWSGIVRRIHQDFLSPAAKAALRARSQEKHFNVR